MVKQVIACVFLLCFTAQTFARQFIVFDYYINTTAYAKNCINKSKPKLHCNGKCQMMQKLKQEEKKDEQMPERKSDGKAEVLFLANCAFVLQEQPVLHCAVFYYTYNNSVEIKMPRSIFHPPGTSL